jgi:allantoinase
MSEAYQRDLVGYGRDPPTAAWPNRARLALSFVLNYEEGGEACLLHGDPASEVFLHEVPGNAPHVGARDLNVESVYEYGARAGFWRILRLFTERRLTLTVYAVGMALERNPEAGQAMVEAGFEVASHGWRWIDYHEVPEHEERAHPQAGGRGRRLPLRFGFLRRRPALLGRGRGQAASGGALYA